MNGILSMHDFFAFIQARSSSTRFPGKVLKSIPPESDKVILSHIIERLIKIIPRENIVLLVPKNDSALIEYAQKQNLFFFEGSEEDVRDRFIQAAKKY